MTAQRHNGWTRESLLYVPDKGERAPVVLGPKEDIAWVEVRGCVRSYPVVPWHHSGKVAIHRVVLCQVDGEAKPRDLGVERFLVAAEQLGIKGAA